MGMIGVKHTWKYPPAPQGFAKDAEVFLFNDRARNSCFDRYCGAWALPDSSHVHKFTLPNPTRPDGFYSDPIAARAALKKYLKEIGR